MFANDLIILLRVEMKKTKLWVT